ncbi:MAG: adenylate/guanylate cyclase domain-containing protein [Myxococcales bacterium]|nr:adenylate/guanylate cyclase domain-containing protein [Myxococcales bacterium]
MHYSWRYPLASDPARVWPLLRDTERMNKAAGLQVVHFSDEAAPEGGACRRGRFIYLGMEIEWDERPYEWVAGKWMSVERVYRKGPMRRMVVHFALEAVGAGSAVTVTVDVVLRALWGMPIVHGQMKGLVGPGFTRAFNHMEAFLQGRVRFAYPDDPPRLAAEAQVRAARAGEMMVAAGVDPVLSAAIVRMILEEPDRDVATLRPYALAARFATARMPTLRALLIAADAGLIQLAWDINCPHCRGGVRQKSLAGVRAMNACLSCNLEYSARFDREVEVTFLPHPAVRQLDLSEHCVGGPGKTPHVTLQRRVPPGATVAVAWEVPAGRWRVRSPLSVGAVDIEVSPPGTPAADLRITIDSAGIAVEGTAVSGASTAQVENKTEFEQLLSVDDPAWSELAASGADVSALHAFRGRFVGEVMPPNQMFEIENMTFLFSDLKASTCMYERAGDDVALTCVREHFAILFAATERCNGAVVKTVGDAVMAVFREPLDALQAAHDAIVGVARIVGPTGDNLVLRVGVHAGRCLAVNLDHRLDYFGSTVNRASRTEHESRGNEVVFTADLADRPAVATWLAGRRVERFAAELRGIAASVQLVRLMPAS